MEVFPYSDNNAVFVIIMNTPSFHPGYVFVTFLRNCSLKQSELSPPPPFFFPQFDVFSHEAVALTSLTGGISGRSLSPSRSLSPHTQRKCALCKCDRVLGAPETWRSGYFLSPQ